MVPRTGSELLPVVGAENAPADQIAQFDVRAFFSGPGPEDALTHHPAAQAVVQFAFQADGRPPAGVPRLPGQVAQPAEGLGTGRDPAQQSAAAVESLIGHPDGFGVGVQDLHAERLECAADFPVKLVGHDRRTAGLRGRRWALNLHNMAKRLSARPSYGELSRTISKESKCPWRRYEPAQNAHILRVCSAFSPSHVLPGTLILILR